ncbi:MAG TPA: glycosyltransferase family 2 protein [Bryobacteraceae bacterium]|nr:glycosyltransferase family 2 protein [Bryobacteraceae bacterium]
MTHNSAQVIGCCLESLADMAPSVAPLVVDNASRDRTLPQAGARHIANPHNRGFAAAVNQGVRASDSEFFLLLNPDVALLTSVDALVEASRAHGLAAGQLVDSGGQAQAGFTIRRFPTPASLIFELFGVNRLWPSNPVNRKYRYLDRPLDQAGAVEQPAGAFLMFRRDVWEKLGGFDEKFYPIWFEDVDFCRRAAQAGYRIEYLPNVQARHRGAHSIAQLAPGCRAVYWCVSLLRYAAKHFSDFGYRAVCMAVLVSSFPRMVAGMMEQRTLAPILAGLRIVRIAGLCLMSQRGRGVVPPNL